LPVALRRAKAETADVKHCSLVMPPPCERRSRSRESDRRASILRGKPKPVYVSSHRNFEAVRELSIATAPTDRARHAVAGTPITVGRRHGASPNAPSA
jgi:hypothetical protein